ncbi:uncharacterized protein DS421_2g34540 [Arachis hypogaea]|nr:uncharacterized protein DS421_2g34540 [Arachis hypogaea]
MQIARLNSLIHQPPHLSTNFSSKFHHTSLIFFCDLLPDRFHNPTRQRSPLVSSLQRCSCRLLISIFGALHHWCRRSDLVESRSSSPSLQLPSLSLLQMRRP